MNTRAGAELTLRLLGSLQATTADGRDVTPPGKKLRALLACLALPPDCGWSRERLTELLWGDRDEEQARSSLRQALAELRRLLGDAALLSDREAVALDPSLVSVDALEFARRAAAGETERAAELYRGDLLDGIALPDAGFGDWLLVERTRFHDLAVEVFARLVDSQSGSAAIASAQRLLQLDPLREPTHRTLMQLYAAGGQRSQALRQFQLCRDALQQELGVKPEPETERLCREIQKAGNGRTLPIEVAAAQLPAGDLGTHAATAIAVPLPVHGVVVATSIVGPARAHLRRMGSRSWRAMAALAVLLAASGVGLGGYFYTRAAGDRTAVAPTPEATIGLPVLLMLPFQNLTDDPAQDKVGVGIAEDLRDLTWHYPELQVVSGTSAGDGAADLAETARKLHAHFVIGGSVRKAGDKMVITAQLIDGATAVNLWSTRIEEVVTDPVALEEAVARRLSDSLGGMTGALRQAYERMAWSKSEAELTEYDYYVRGHSHHHGFKKEEVDLARNIYATRLERYPNSALLRIKIAMTYLVSMYKWSDDPAADAAQFRRLAAEAATLMASGRRSRFEELYLHWIGAYAAEYDRDYSRCVAEAGKAVALDRNDPMLLADLAFPLAECGKPDEAIAQARDAIARDPAGPPGWPEMYVSAQVWASYLAGRCDEAIAVMEKMTNRPLTTLAACYRREGNLEQARRVMAAFIKDNPHWTLTNERTFPIQMSEPLRQRWFEDIRGAGLPETEVAETPPTTTPAAEPPPGPSTRQGIPVIVVLPFKDLTGDQVQTDWGVGIAEKFATDLSTFPDYQVVSSTSSAIYAGISVPQIKAASGATFVVEGNYARGKRVEFEIRLVRASTDLAVWHTAFDFETTDPVTLQKSAAMKLRDTLGGMTGALREEYTKIAKEKVVGDLEGTFDGNLTEYDYYVLGHIYHLRWPRSDKDRRLTRAIWEQGLKNYPDSVLLSAKLSFSYGAASMKGTELLERVEKWKDRTRLDEWYYHWAKAFSCDATGKDDCAFAEARAAITLAPYDVLSHADLSEVAVDTDHAEEGIAWVTFAVTHDPQPKYWYFDNLIRAYDYCNTKWPDAIALAESQLASAPSPSRYWYKLLGQAYAATDQMDKSKAAFDKFYSMDDSAQ